jgi:chaperonin GroES
MALNIKPLSDAFLSDQLLQKQNCLRIFFQTLLKKPQKRTVVAVGNGTKEHTMTVKIGDSVLYGKYAGTELKLEGKDYLIMRSDILAII